MLLAVSVDLDETHHYRQLHGLPGPRGREVYDLALPRFSSWADERGIPLTLFVVGEDVARPQNAERLATLASRGHELGCHSHSHLYDLTRRSALEMRSEVARGIAAVSELTKRAVQGFRAPGYVVNDALLGIVHELGLSYDSSVFPCPAYYAAKAGAIAVQMLRRQGERSTFDTPNVLRAPTMPYRIGTPYWLRGSGILEIPIQVTRGARLPFIGTSLALAGRSGARLLARAVAGTPFVNLELHGLDALDASDGLQQLQSRQPDLRLGWRDKLSSIGAAVELLQTRGYRCVRLDELAGSAVGA